MGDVPKAMESSGREVDARQRFGRLLSDALKTRRLTQEDLAARLGTTQSSVSGWINGRYEPSAETVFAVERALELEPGHLSRPLGYLPVDAASRPVSVEHAIAQSDLGDDERAALIGMYRVLVKRSGTTTGGRQATKSAGTPGRSRLTTAPLAPGGHRSAAGSH